MLAENELAQPSFDRFHYRPFVQGEFIMPPDYSEEELLSSHGVGIVQRIRIVEGLLESEIVVIPSGWAMNLTDGGFEYVLLNRMDQSGAGSDDSKKTGDFQLYACVTAKEGLLVTDFREFSAQVNKKKPIVSFKSTNAGTFFRAIWGEGYREVIQRFGSLGVAKIFAADYPRYYVEVGDQGGKRKRSGDVI